MGKRPRDGGVALKVLAVMAMGVLLCGLGPAARSAMDDAGPVELRFARLAYADTPWSAGRGRSGRGGSWLTDAPEAEMHLLQGVRRLTRVQSTADSVGIRPADEALFDHPFLYAVEVGRWYLTDEDAAQLREYLLRGGFLMVDDFHGSAEWEGFMESLRRVFPDRPVVDLPDGSAVFHVLYDLDQRTQIPGVFALMGGRTYERDGVEPRWRGVFDDEGRLMVAINFNMDLGDAWEHADTPEYPQPLTALAYRFGVNYILYAFTH
ncbi:MAG: hypothetical protein RL026_2802 [Pseudomonadota bacterium]|jgi:hypothetical protein